MGRWPQGARERLTAAALDLFARRGYAGTTVDDVAAAAGVSQRTFFRHFRDKEEVLFADDDRLLSVLVDAITADEHEASPDTMRTALAAVAAELEGDSEALRLRASVIWTDVALTGRELVKQARWREAVAVALVDRGYPAERAGLLAGVGFAVFRQALDGWLADDGGPGLVARVDAGLAELSRTFGGPPSAGAATV